MILPIYLNVYGYFLILKKPLENFNIMIFAYNCKDRITVC